MNSLNRKEITYINTLKLAIVVTILSMAIADISDPLEWLQMKTESHPKIGEKPFHSVTKFVIFIISIFSFSAWAWCSDNGRKVVDMPFSVITYYQCFQNTSYGVPLAL